jgi:hypothetical protein
MALQVTGDYETPIGTTLPTTYWRWVGLGIDVSRLTATATVYGYVDAAAFAAGKTNVGQKQYSITGDDFMSLAAQIDGPEPVPVSQAIYNYVKTHDEFFTDATEV